MKTIQFFRMENGFLSISQPNSPQHSTQTPSIEKTESIDKIKQGNIEEEKTTTKINITPNRVERI